jgi:DNA repair protein RadC
MIIHEPVVSYRKKTIEKVLIDTGNSAYNYLKNWMETNGEIKDFGLEHLILVSLNTRGCVIKTEILSIGTDTSCLVKPSIVLRQVLINRAQSFIIAHNHPSGDPSPSTADRRITRQIAEASITIDLNFLDHLVIGEKENDSSGIGYYSFRESGNISN